MRRRAAEMGPPALIGVGNPVMAGCEPLQLAPVNDPEAVGITIMLGLNGPGRGAVEVQQGSGGF